MKITFDDLFNEVLSWWPIYFSGEEDDFVDDMHQSSISRLYELKVEELALE